MRIVRQMLSESLLIAALGAGAGVLAAGWFTRALVAFLSSTDSPLFVDLGLDWRAFAFTVSVAVAASLIFGVAPAVRATAISPGASMKAGGRGTTEGRERLGLRRALVVLQIAVSLVLVVGALLFARSLRNLTTRDPGFRQDGLLTASIDTRNAALSDAAQVAANARIVEAVRAIPGVTAVTQVFTTPVGGNLWNENLVIGGAVQKEAVNINSVGPGYFQALAIPLVSGRDFDARDTPTSPKVAIVSQSFARQYFPGRDPVGQSFQVFVSPGEPNPFIQIVGVAGDTRYTDLREAFLPLVYLAAAQEAKPGSRLSLVIRAETSLAGVAPAVTRAITDVNSTFSIEYQTVRAQVDQSLLRERLIAILSGFFGGLAMLIATIGLYGVMSYTVARRRVEIGVRMALGADRATVIRLIVREAGLLLGAGLLIGSVLAVLATRAADAFLFGLTPRDPVTFAMAAGSLAAVTLLASWLPARRASRLTPTVALREE
jgi:predicted permease